MPLILGANSVSGYTVKNSLRFNAGSSDYLNRTPSSTTDRQKATLSFWTKYCDDTSGNIGRLFNFGLYPNGTLIYFGDGAYKGKLLIDSYVSTSATVGLVTTQLFRDYSAWYHIVVAFDTTQATASNRVKLYVNGTQVTTFDASVYPSQNENLFFNFSSSTYQIGKNHQPAYFSGYLAETYMIDGQQLTPSSFGETDTLSGIWIPKSYTGSYGTNGFFLKFANSASLGTDSSGNGNTFTVNNLTSVDQSTDTPTNNFATFLTLNDWNGKSSSQPTISEGNLKFSGSGGWIGEQVSSIAMSTGKWYWEITSTTVGLSNLTFGIVNTNNINEIGTRTGSYGYASSGEKWNGATNTAYGATWTANDVIGVAFDATNGTLAFYKNGTSQGTAFTGITSTSYNAWFMTYNSVGTVNFGSPVVSSNGYTDGAGFGNFSYAVPSGYYALCTKNLANFG